MAWDQRGHGDSDHTALYSWDADLRDAVAVMTSVTGRAVPVIGHSKGGALMTQLADCQPHRVSQLVNLDGLPSRGPVPDVANHDRTRMLAAELSSWLDHRRRASTVQRKPGTIDELARRRGRMNPRLSVEWLRYLVTLGAREDEDGWRWKIDPSLRFGGFGPWRPEWSLQRMPGLGMPFLAVLGLVVEDMGWGTRPDDVTPYLPLGARFEVLARHRPLRPHRAARADRRPRARLRRAAGMTVDHPAPRRRRPRAPSPAGRRRAVASSCSTGWASGRRPRCRPGRPAGPGPVWGLDFTGHGASTIPLGGGYTAEVLMADADLALAELGPATVVGRGLGAYIALLIAGARPALVEGAVLDDGPGLAGGGPYPGTTVILSDLVVDRAAPDEWALSELARDVRPPDYATSFARQATQLSGLDWPVAVCARSRPPWLEAVAAEPGVLDTTLDEALRRYAARA